MSITRRELLRSTFAAGVLLGMPGLVGACASGDPEQDANGDVAEELPNGSTGGSTYEQPDPADEQRLRDWVEAVRQSGMAEPDIPVGRTAVAVGELAVGARTPYRAYTLEEYLTAGAEPMRIEPLTLSLQYFDCITLVEACLAIARVARRPGSPEWASFARAMERMRYRGGERKGYLSRLHYFSEWLDDNERRGLVQLLGEELGGVPDRRPLRFMTTHRDEYPALAYPGVYESLVELERSLDDRTRWVIPTERINAVAERIQTGDILGFATSIEGLDVTHGAFAFRDEAGGLHVLHAPLSGGVVEVTDETLYEYVAQIRSATGILLARPLMG